VSAVVPFLMKGAWELAVAVPGPLGTRRQAEGAWGEMLSPLEARA